MCGIAGIVSYDPRAHVDAARVMRMRDCLAHRGPDEAGLWVDGPVGLGHRRLSIVDVDAGQQPMTNEDGSILIVFNGEIYNHRELRPELMARGHVYRTRCDTESILHLYEERGIDGLAALEGMFAFALWDRRGDRLVLGRDRLGIKPLYIAELDGALLFASEIKALIAGGLRAELNVDVVPDYLANRYVAGADTLFRGVTQVPPGHWLTWSVATGRRMHRYWSVPARMGTCETTMAQAAERVRDDLHAAVERHLMSDVPIGVFLSGGIDSTALAAIAAEMADGRLSTFSVGFREREGNELPYARLAAKAIDSDHHEVELDADAFFAHVPSLVWHQDGPLAFSSCVPLYAVSSLAQSHVKVVLTGEGADELFLGYNRYRVTQWNARLGRPYWRLPTPVRRAVRRGVAGLPSSLRRYASRSFVAYDDECRGLFFDNFSVFSMARLSRLLAAPLRTEPFAVALRCYEAVDGDALDRMSAADLQTYLVELLMKQDRMSMAASIESRVPFLDDRLVSLVLDLPSSVKLRGWQTKAVLRAAVADRIPREILTRRKMGFPVPLARWFRGRHAALARELVLGERARTRGLFRIDALETLLAEHEAGIGDHAERLWLLINLEIWQRIFCDGDAPGDVVREIAAPPGRIYARDVDQGRRVVAAEHGRPAADV
jgi:asparagine synthase (glutamine-hydrolysing)